MEQISPLERKSDETRARIFKVALQFIDEYGAESLTVRKLAKEADVSPALIIQYFGSKGQLFREAYDYCSADLLEQISAFADGPSTGRLEGVLTGLVDIFLKRDLRHRDLTLQVLTHTLTGDDQTQAILDKKFEITLQALGGLIRHHLPTLTAEQARTAAGSLALLYGNAIKQILRRRMDHDTAKAFIEPHLRIMAYGIQELAKR